MSLTPSPPSDLAQLRRLVVQANAAAHEGAPTQASTMTSDLSIDEELVLHSIGHEPIELVTGTSVFAVPYSVWRWGQGEIEAASGAYLGAFAAASKRLHTQCAESGGHGVVGVDLQIEVERTHVTVTMAGTAIRPVGSKPVPAGNAFVSDLSARDFALLTRAGWNVVGLCAGASFVYAPRRALGQAMKQSAQNVELTNYTEAMYAARESAMERMQSSALALKATGVVGVSITEGPLPFAGHAIGFCAWGTAVAVGHDGHLRIAPSMVVPLDDPVPLFDAASLKGR